MMIRMIRRLLNPKSKSEGMHLLLGTSNFNIAFLQTHPTSKFFPLLNKPVPKRKKALVQAFETGQ